MVMKIAVLVVIASSIAVQAGTYLWPRGEYGIISHADCPKNWFEFTHCQDTENTNNRDELSKFKLRLAYVKCERSSVTIRYCFKGKALPTRKGGFFTNSGKHGTAFVIKNVNGNCNKFGQDGGTVDINNENDNNKNKYGNRGLNNHTHDGYYPQNFNFNWDSGKEKTHLEFCEIGKGGGEPYTDYIEVGEFHRQKFGLFNFHGKPCPMLESPDGVLVGTRQPFFLDDDDSTNKSRSDGGAPVNITGCGSSWSVCAYDPEEALNPKQVNESMLLN